MATPLGGGKAAALLVGHTDEPLPDGTAACAGSSMQDEALLAGPREMEPQMNADPTTQ